MSEARLIKSQHFKSQIFEEQRAAGRVAKKSNTYSSSVFAHVVPERGPRLSTPVAKNYARQRYQLSSTVFAGSIEQASSTVEKTAARLSPSRMKTAGKKVNPTSDFTYKPRLSVTQKSEVFSAFHLGEGSVGAQKTATEKAEVRRLANKVMRERPNSDASTPMARTMTSINLQKTGSEVAEFVVTGLYQSMTSESLRKMCGNLHIVSAKADEDPLTGECRGTGKLQLRVARGREEDIQRLQRTLDSKGFRLLPAERRSTSVRPR